MHADDLSRSLRGTCEVSDRNRWSVACDDCSLLQNSICGTQHWFLNVGILENGLNYKIDIIFLQRVYIPSECKVSFGFVCVFLGQFLFRDFLLEPVFHKLLWFFDRDVIRIVDNDWDLGDVTSNNGYTGSHLACSDHPEWFDCAEQPGYTLYHHLY